MKKKYRRYEMKEGKGGKHNRFWVWDIQEKRVYKGMLAKAAALDLARRLNGGRWSRGVSVRHNKAPSWWSKLWSKFALKIKEKFGKKKKRADNLVIEKLEGRVRRERRMMIQDKNQKHLRGIAGRK